MTCLVILVVLLLILAVEVAFVVWNGRKPPVVEMRGLRRDRE